MNQHHPRSLADNPNLIRGIFNYCDRWCERCTHTARCLSFQMEQARVQGEPPEAPDQQNAAFWDQIGKSLAVARAMLDDFMQRDGVTLSEADPDATPPADNRDDERVANHPCSRAARAYIGLVDAWFTTGTVAWQATTQELEQAAAMRLPGRAPRSELAELNEVVDVIRYYQPFLFPKIGRALQGRLDGDPCGDASGSAKIALIAMDRSLGAWSQLHAHFPEREGATLPVLVHLEKLRHAVERVFPKARVFVRPGLDEPGT